jgi:thiol-disulfide isomerase/thioredoxin
MSPSKHIVQIITAAVVLTMALMLIFGAGLPERAQFTGQMLADGIVAAPELNAIAPNFALNSLEATAITLEKLRGTPILINFWATWCEPCRIEMPILQAFYESHRSTGLRVLAVNIGESPDIIRTWVDELGLTFDIVLDPQQSLMALYQVRGQPSTYFVSSSGIITSIFYGPVSAEQLQAVLP